MVLSKKLVIRKLQKIRTSLASVILGMMPIAEAMLLIVKTRQEEMLFLAVHIMIDYSDFIGSVEMFCAYP